MHVLKKQMITKTKEIGLCKILRKPSGKFMYCNVSILAAVSSALSSGYRILLP